VATIQSLGVGSGLDVNSIIQQLLSIERQPLTRLQRAASGVETEISLYGNIRSKADSIGSAARTLADANTWRQTAVNLNGADEFSLTAASTASPVRLDVEITELAQRQSVSTQAFASSGASVGTGILTIQRGSWSADFAAFTPDTEAAPIEVAIGAGQDTLAGIRDAINAAGAGVTASILNDANGARLVIRSDEPGAKNGFSLSTLGGTDAFDALAFTQQTSPPSGSGAQGDVRATNLRGRINGAVVESTTNTLSNVLDGISITATKATTAARSVLIERNLADMKAKVDGFVTAYNDLIGYLKAQTAYNESTRTAAPLQGDRVALTVQNQLRGAAIDPTEASETFTRLSDIGISLQVDGKLKVDASKLDKALENLDEVARLFSRDEEGTAQDGLALRISSMIDALTDTGGTIDSKQATLRDRLKRNEDDQARMEDRLAATEARLKAQYTALDSRMTALNGLGSYINQQFGGGA
jgi:flagellar hook-associated protein 2